MTELMQASRQWASRPHDERFTSLLDMNDHFDAQRSNSRAVVVPSRVLTAEPMDDHRGLTISGANGVPYAPTHHAFGQLATLAGAPAGYLRTLPSEMAADCLNFGLKVHRPNVKAEDTGILLYKNGGEPMLRAATGPQYGRIWNNSITRGLIDRFGDGITGQFRVPGEFGNAVTVTKDNTTLFAGDRDMFVFLADEERRITIPNRRNGQNGSMARGFFVWNSEVGSATFGLATFLFDYVCCNRIVWGAAEYKELKIRHTSGAPDRFFREISPALQTYAASSDASITLAIADAQKDRIDTDLNDWLSKRFSKGVVKSMVTAHELEEGRPIETRWDAVVAATAVARGIPNQDDRVDLERTAGKLMG